VASEETRISNDIRLQESERGHRLFRNNRGKFRTLDGRRIVQAGLSAPGSSDLIGWKQIEITQEMVGQKVALFYAVEVKTKTGTVADDQSRFVDAVNAAGGVGVIARHQDDLIESA
jgi:hypothetical protein